jgi:hypothetical protein
VKRSFPVVLVSLTRLTWHSDSFPIEAPLIPFKMNVFVTPLMGELGAFLQTYRKFMRQSVIFKIIRARWVKKISGMKNQ